MTNKKHQLPLALELAEPKLLAGEVDIQLASQTTTCQQSHTTNFILGVLQDLVNDLAVDDVIA